MPTVLKYGSLRLLEPSGPVQIFNTDCFIFTDVYTRSQNDNTGDFSLFPSLCFYDTRGSPHMPIQEQTGGGRCSSNPFAIQRYKRVGGQHHAPAALSPGKDALSIVQKAVMGSEVGLKGHRKYPPLPKGFRSPDRPARSVVAIPTELSQPPSIKHTTCR